MSLVSFLGFDSDILKDCKSEQIKSHWLLSLMFFVNICLFALGTYHFFSVSIHDPVLLYPIVLLLSYIYLAYTKMIIATHDHDLYYFYVNETLLPIRHDFSITLRIFVVFIFTLLCGSGYVLWVTEPLFLDILAELKAGKYNHQPEVFEYLMIKNGNFESIDNITDRFKIMFLVFGNYSVLFIFLYLFVSFVLLLPFIMKFYIDELSNGEYETRETRIETDLIISDYQYTVDYINWIRKTKYGLPRIEYQAFADPPFNKVWLPLPYETPDKTI